VDEQIINNNASVEPTEVETEIIDPGSTKEHWLKRNKSKFLLGIIGILTLCLLGTIETLTKTEQQLKQRTESLSWIAFEHQKVRNERDFYSKLTKDYDYYKFVKTIYEHKDPDFFETITIAYEESVKQNTSPWDTLSIMWAESGFNQYAVSQIWKVDKKDGQLKQVPCAYGMMQINKKYWEEEKGLTMSNIFDKKTNIRVGLEIYNYYLGIASRIVSDPKEQKKLALFYYNNGTDPEKPNYSYAPIVMKSKFMKMAVNYEPIEPIEHGNVSKGISQ
jgi:hypothetical protein